MKIMEEWSYIEVEGWIKTRNHPHHPPTEYVWVKPKNKLTKQGNRLNGK